MRQIRVLQIVDSLQACGAEMVAINLANELSKQEAIVSYLLSSRAGGELEKRISPDVRHFSLHKKRTVAPLALWHLYRLFRKENFDIVHVHSATFYYPVILKRFFNYKLVWHDHYGKKMSHEKGRRDRAIKTFAGYFDHSFAANRQLVETDKKIFGIKSNKISFLPSFSTAEIHSKPAESPIAELKGSRYDRVVCLANLLPQKDHISLLRAFKLVLLLRPTSYLYLVGKGNRDAYERKVVQVIKNLGLQRHVKWLGSIAYPAEILNHCSIGVLSSEFEGMPLAVIEYGLSQLAVVATSVGEIPSLLTNDENAILVPPKNPEALAAALLTLLNNKPKTIALQRNLANLVHEKHSANSVMQEMMTVYHQLLGNNL